MTATVRWSGLVATLAALLHVTPERMESPAVRAVPVASAQPVGLARLESAYARAVTALSDSAVHQRDFFPARVQLRLQTALLDPREAPAVPFDALAQRAASAARAVFELAEQFGNVAVPADLAAHHAAVLAALREEAGALDLLASAATACETDVRDELRCRTPLADASIRLSRASRRYLDARRRIREQIADTGTLLPEFATRDR